MTSALEPLQRALVGVVGKERVLTDPGDRHVYGYDNSRKHHPPDAVVFALTENEVRDLVAVCRAHKTPLVARGRGTGTAGAAVPVRGGVVLSLERMRRTDASSFTAITSEDPSARASSR